MTKAVFTFATLKLHAAHQKQVMKVVFVEIYEKEFEIYEVFICSSF
jgi:hypothetical protein